MATIIWAPSALDDIDSIAEYISRDSTDRLKKFPLAGRIIPGIGNPNCRENIY